MVLKKVLLKFYKYDYVSILIYFDNKTVFPLWISTISSTNTGYKYENIFIRDLPTRLWYIYVNK